VPPDLILIGAESAEILHEAVRVLIQRGSCLPSRDRRGPGGVWLWLWHRRTSSASVKNGRPACVFAWQVGNTRISPASTLRRRVTYRTQRAWHRHWLPSTGGYPPADVRREVGYLARPCRAHASPGPGLRAQRAPEESNQVPVPVVVPTASGHDDAR
jgi:hypothetical protein